MYLNLPLNGFVTKRVYNKERLTGRSKEWRGLQLNQVNLQIQTPFFLDTDGLEEKEGSKVVLVGVDYLVLNKEKRLGIPFFGKSAHGSTKIEIKKYFTSAIVVERCLNSLKEAFGFNLQTKRS